MRSLLVSIDAKYIHTNNAVRLLQANCDFDVELIEFTIKDSIETILEGINQVQPDMVGFSVYIWNVDIVKSLLKELDQTMTIVLGGPEVSYDPKHFLAIDNVDYIISGEGELAFNQLLHHIVHGLSVESIDNLSYHKNDTIIVNQIVEITDLSTLNPPYYRNEDIDHIPHKISYIESSRGCPYRCSYCLSSLEKSVRFFPLKTVKEAISYLMKHGSKTIKFLDRTFNANRHTLAIIDHIIASDNNKTSFQFEITGDVLKEEILDYIHNNARRGLFRFEIGIQSTNKRTNLLVDRYQNTEVLFDRIRLIQSKGIIDLHLDLIAGLPEEGKESFIQTFNQVYTLGSKELQLGFLKMLRGTKIRIESHIFGYQYDITSPYEIQSNDVLSKVDIDEIKLVEHMLEIYHNKGYFGPRLHSIILSQSSPYHFFKMLGEHYTSNNYSMHRYQIKDVYRRLLECLSEENQYLVLQDYLTRFPIKPERFFELSITKSERNQVLKNISSDTVIPLHMLYKHSILIRYKDEYFCAYYQDNICHPYTIKAPE